MRYRVCLLMIALGTLTFSENADALDYNFRGQLSWWGMGFYEQDALQVNSGGRYIPSLRLDQFVDEDKFIDLEASLNGFAAISTLEPGETADLDLYRLNLRFATNQTETQLGLQRINFGPAQLLRPLQWFDQLDPRDPQNLTDGVYALRFRYTALNNANLWLWSLYGNDRPKGYDFLPSVTDIPEFGGRFQYPLFNGELAASLHTREVDASTLHSPNFRENRIALDGRWEVKIGMWFETMLQQQQTDIILYEWTKLTSLGFDYTFGVGNGLYLLGEHMFITLSEDPFGWDTDTQTSAILVNYPLGLFDTLTAIGYYLWDKSEYSLYLAWQRTYDNLSFNVSLFHYPESEVAEEIRETPVGGYGGQLMIIFYH